MIVPTYIPLVLEAVRREYADAFIAGGALRDIRHGYDPKDIDVFTFAEPTVDEVINQGECSCEGYDDSRIAMVQQDRIIPGCAFPVQIIHLVPYELPQANTPGTAVSDFAINFQRIWYDGFVHMDPEFDDDAINRKYTVNRCENWRELDRIFRKVESLVPKYGNRPLIIPPGVVGALAAPKEE